MPSEHTNQSPSNTFLLDLNVRSIVSLIIVLHFVAIITCYASNWRRSGVQDELLQFAHPYLVGCNWYVEMLPIEWSKADSADLKATLSIERKMDAVRLNVLESGSRTVDRARCRQLLRLLVSVTEAGDDDGAALLLSSVLKQHALDRPENPIVSVRLEKLLEADDSSYSVIYEAKVKQLISGEIRLVPVLESQRTVPALANPSTPSESSRKES